MSRIITLLQNKMSRLPVLIGMALSWWRSELSELIAPLWRRIGHQTESVLLIVGADSELLAPADAQNASHEHTKRKFVFPDNWQRRCAGRQVSVCLDPAQVLLLPVKLPRRGLASMKAAIKYKLLTESPLLLDQIYYDARVVPSYVPTRKPNDVIADVAICRRSTTEELERTLGDAGVSACIIGYSTESKLPLDYVFHTSQAARAAHINIRTNLWLMISALLIGLGAFPVTNLGANWLTDQIRGEVQLLTQNQESLIPLYEQRALIHTANNELKKHVPEIRLSSLLNDIANSLPQTIWLKSIRYDNNRLTINGYAPTPTTALHAIERTGILTQVNIDSVTEAGTGSDAKQIQFELSASVQRGRPE